MLLHMCQLLGLLLFLTGFYGVAVFIFARGFLLQRTVLLQNNKCDVNFADMMNNNRAGCWMHTRFERAVIIIIDGLRYDFLAPNLTSSNSNIHYYNRLIAVHEKLLKENKHSLLYKFIADPPTTTMQRLKGLTTGSLPTFIEAGSNFKTPEIIEDNIIDQLIGQNKKITFLGDDTWTGLFPKRFERSFPFPSFNVKDLHTVDSGIQQHLSSELIKTDWDVLIAHFLGVDHCGHRFGPNHTAMAEKLIEMNEMIDSVMKLLEEDTVLFIFGDHGMSNTGDHGGDSKDEIESGLFIYSPSQLIVSPSKSSVVETISQVDFVPTISLLLGIPIPFSNLGMVMNDLFSYCPWWNTEDRLQQLYHNIKVLHLNAHQIDEYFQAYSNISAEPTIQKKYISLHNQFMSTEEELNKIVMNLVKLEDVTETQLLKVKNSYISFISQVKSMCQESWATFDVQQIRIGLFTLCFAISIGIFLLRVTFTVDGSFPKSIYFVLIGTFIHLICVLGVYCLNDTGFSILTIVFDILILTAIIYMVITKTDLKTVSTYFKIQMKNMDLTSICSYFVCFLYIVSFFSNSYVVSEDGVTAFLVLTLVWCYCIQLLAKMLHDKEVNQRENIGKRSKSSLKFDIGYVLIHPSFLTVLLTILFSISVHLSFSFRTCREEQQLCQPSIFSSPLSTLSDNETKNLRYFFSVACIVTIIVISHRWLHLYGNLNGNSPAVLFHKYGFPFVGLCIVLHWAVQSLPSKVLDTLPPIQHVVLAQFAYVLLGLSLLSFFINPLCIYLIQKNNKNFTLPLGWHISLEENIPQIFNALKSWKSNEKDQDVPAMVYGLGTVQTASSLYWLILCSLLIIMLLGDGIAPSILLALLIICIFLELHSTYYHSFNKQDSGLDIPWSAVSMWGLLSVFFFYATGHQASIPNIQWQAAFVGFYGDFSNQVIPAILITINTFAGPILFTIAAPLLIFWPHVNKPAVEYFSNKKKNQDSVWKGDIVLFEKKSVPLMLFKIYASLFLFSSIILFGSMGAAALHRRHLMVWKIFAPRFLFSAAMTGVVFTSGLISFLLMIHVQNSLSLWIDKLGDCKTNP